jgi:hypothetical protein
MKWNDLSSLFPKIQIISTQKRSVPPGDEFKYSVTFSNWSLKLSLFKGVSALHFFVK